MPIYKTGKSKDGKQQYRVCVNYTTVKGEYRQKSKLVYGLGEAKLLECSLENEVEQKQDTSQMTLKELYEEYLIYKKHSVRETSLYKTRSILEREVLPNLNNLPLKKLNIKVLQEWKAKLQEKDISITTKQNIYGEFRALLNYGVKMEYIPRNPLIFVGNFKEVYFEKPQDKLHFYTPEQFKDYISVAQCDCKSITDWGYYVFFCIAFYTGMRKGEINALRWSDIENNVIHIRRSVAQKIKGKSIIETPPKNKSSYRDVQMPSVLIKVLNEHLTRQQNQKGFSPEFRVCGGVDCLRDTSIENRNKQFAELASLPHIRIHDFRHSHASLLVNNGINIQEVARRLGHSKVEITWNTYSHLYPREEEKAISVLESI